MLDREIRVLVVDDSVVVRSIIADSIAATPGMKVVGTAGDGQQALAVLDSVRPDVVTLDVQMPKMDGMATLEAILSRYPVPIIMVSSLTKAGAETTFEALERGALDFLAKPDYGAKTRAVLMEELPRKIRMAAGADVKKILAMRKDRKLRPTDAPVVKPTPTETTKAAAREFTDRCVAIGISTGGPPALAQLFAGLTPPLPPIVIVQHMPPSFTKPLAWRLDSLSALTIREASQGDVLEPNCAWLAPGGKHLSVRRQGSLVKLVVSDGPAVSGHKPSVDVLMNSVAEAYGQNAVGVIMTGMGHDGAAGCGAIRAAGGFVLGQNEATSAVYGMNKVAFVEGHVHRQFGLNEAAAVISRQARGARQPV